MLGVRFKLGERQHGCSQRAQHRKRRMYLLNLMVKACWILPPPPPLPDGTQPPPLPQQFFVLGRLALSLSRSFSFSLSSSTHKPNYRLCALGSTRPSRSRRSPFARPPLLDLIPLYSPLHECVQREGLATCCPSLSFSTPPPQSLRSLPPFTHKPSHTVPRHRRCARGSATRPSLIRPPPVLDHIPRGLRVEGLVTCSTLRTSHPSN